MVVYFDKENCLSYLKTFNDHPEGPDTVRMLKKQLNVHLNFSLDDLDEYELILLEEFQTGVSVDFKLSHSEERVPRPINQHTIPSKSGVYLLGEGVQALRNSHAVLAAGVGDEVATLKTLVIADDYSFHSEKVIGVDITPANHLDLLSFPFSTLVIVDRYLFKGSEIGGNLGLYDHNLKKLLTNIYSLKRNGPSRLILIYQVNVRVARNDRSYDAGPDLTSLSSKLKGVVLKHCPAPEIYLIGVPKGVIDDEHDRYIISDYLRIKSGDCLVYFASNGTTMTKSKTVDFYSYGKREYRKVSKILLDKIIKIVQDTLDNHPAYSKVPNDTISTQVINFN